MSGKERHSYEMKQELLESIDAGSILLELEDNLEDDNGDPIHFLYTNRKRWGVADESGSRKMKSFAIYPEGHKGNVFKLYYRPARTMLVKNGGVEEYVPERGSLIDFLLKYDKKDFKDNFMEVWNYLLEKAGKSDAELQKRKGPRPKSYPFKTGYFSASELKALKLSADKANQLFEAGQKMEAERTLSSMLSNIRGNAEYQYARWREFVRRHPEEYTKEEVNRTEEYWKKISNTSMLRKIENKSSMNGCMDDFVRSVNNLGEAGRAFCSDISARQNFPKEYTRNVQDRIIKYLCRERGISKRLVQNLMDEGMIRGGYPYHKSKNGSKKRGRHLYAAFLNFSDGLVTDLFQRTVNENAMDEQSRIYARMEDPHNLGKGWMLQGGRDAETLYVFEAYIDMLSYLTLLVREKKDISNGCYLALGGAGKADVLSRAVRKHVFKNIVFCYDNDNAGLTASISQMNKFCKKGFSVRMAVPFSKDWNEELKHVGERRYEEYLNEVKDTSFKVYAPRVKISETAGNSLKQKSFVDRNCRLVFGDVAKNCYIADIRDLRLTSAEIENPVTFVISKNGGGLEGIITNGRFWTDIANRDVINIYKNLQRKA